MSWLPLLGLLLAGPAPEPIPAKPAPEAVTQADSAAVSDESLIMNAWVNPESCNLRIARPVDLRRFLADSGAWQGRCIAVTGIWSRYAFFRSLSDTRRRYATSTSALEGRRLGIYAHEDVWAEAPRHARLSTLVGRVGHCETHGFWGGYCHYVAEGPFIMVAEAYEGRRTPTDRLRPAH
jgi:hypothetical protein